MADLRDPDLPPGEIVEKRDDGVWVRNDGVELQPAEKNPWYVLATVFGEQEGRYDKELAAKNRRIWNGWACSRMQPDARRKLEAEIELEPGDLDPLTPEEMAQVHAAFKDRLGDAVPVPETGIVDMSKTHFSHTVVWEKCVFAEFADFSSAHFAGRADFSSAHFAEFADFSSAHFAERAYFPSAHFYETAAFDAAHFAGHARFNGAKFDGLVWFKDGVFKNATDFQDAQFLGGVPKFHQREFHDDTNFTQKAVGRDGTRYWPEVQSASDGGLHNKNAYRKLRQVAANQHNPEAEHFFLRQEMACDAVLKEDWLSRWVIRLFGVVSSYGFSIGRPGGALLALWFVPSLFYAVLFKSGAVMPVWASYVSAYPEAWLTAMGFSFSNLFSFFGLSGRHFGDVWNDAPSWVHFLGGAQTVFGFIFLFFLGLGLRNRFRLK